MPFCFDDRSRMFNHKAQEAEEPHLILRYNALPTALGSNRAAVFGSALWGARGMTKGEKSVDPSDEREWRKRSRRLHSLELHLIRDEAVLLNSHFEAIELSEAVSYTHLTLPTKRIV